MVTGFKIPFKDDGVGEFWVDYCDFIYKWYYDYLK